MTLPSADTPLYNHALPDLEKWLSGLGCKQDRENLHCWNVERLNWKANLCLEIEELIVHYTQEGQSQIDIKRAFKYSLSRKDIESAVFAGP